MKVDILAKAAAKPMEMVARKLAPLTMRLSKRSPEILLVSGIAAMAGGAVLVGVTTWKDLPARVLECEEELFDISNGYEDDAPAKEKAIVMAKAGLRIAKDYIPAAVLIGGGACMVVGGHNQLRTRLGALSAAYATLESAYSNYRGRVVECYGEDVDRKFRLNIREEEVSRTVETKNGKEKEEVKVIEGVHADGSEYSLYARYFDAFNSNMFVRDQEQNFDFLRIQQGIADEKLHRKGYLFLNEVYDALGFKEVPEGQLVGWVLDPEGENHVDFGLYEARNNDMRDFVNNSWDNPNCFVLDFNVDGVMWDLI